MDLQITEIADQLRRVIEPQAIRVTHLQRIHAELLELAGAGELSQAPVTPARPLAAPARAAATAPAPVAPQPARRAEASAPPPAKGKLRCCKCHQDLPPESFARSKTKRGRAYACKPCHYAAYHGGKSAPTAAPSSAKAPVDRKALIAARAARHQKASRGHRAAADAEDEPVVAAIEDLDDPGEAADAEPAEGDNAPPLRMATPPRVKPHSVLPENRARGPGWLGGRRRRQQMVSPCHGRSEPGSECGGAVSEARCRRRGCAYVAIRCKTHGGQWAADQELLSHERTAHALLELPAPRPEPALRTSADQVARPVSGFDWGPPAAAAEDHDAA